MWKKYSSILLILIILSCGGGEDDYTPKPRGYFRIAVPEQEYAPLKLDMPYDFEKNTAAKWEPKNDFWGDVYYPSLKGRLQLTYKNVNDHNLETLLKDGRQLAYEHVVKADGIEDIILSFPEHKVYGMMYRLKGEVATSTQFFVTDSANHFLRGVLYFYASPNSDSLQPVNEYMYEESMHLLETLEWQN